MANFEHLKVGDKVTRMLGGEIHQVMTVTEIRGDSLICDLWEFDRKTGAEIDDMLGWGPKYGRTGSFLKEEKP